MSNYQNEEKEVYPMETCPLCGEYTQSPCVECAIEYANDQEFGLLFDVLELELEYA